MHAPALGLVCDGGIEGNDSRLRRCAKFAAWAGAVGGLIEDCDVSSTPVSAAVLFRRRLLPIHDSLSLSLHALSAFLVPPLLRRARVGCLGCLGCLGMPVSCCSAYINLNKGQQKPE
jgi:hypothetical protein